MIFSPAMGSLERMMSGEEIESMVKIVQGDITDSPHLFRTIQENKVEKIIHTASLTVLDSNTNPYLAVKVNCEGTVCVFEAARNLGLKKVVWASSNASSVRRRNILRSISRMMPPMIHRMSMRLPSLLMKLWQLPMLMIMVWISQG